MPGATLNGHLRVFLAALGAARGLGAFTGWARAFNKTYRDRSDELQRRAAFLGNGQLVERLNRAGEGVEYGLSGPWADLTPAEFAAQVLMPPRAAPAALDSARKPWVHAGNVTLPQSFDWSTQGVVTAVRDQGALGSCWAFSAAESVEGQYARATGKLLQLSAEQLVECDAGTDQSCHGQGSKHDSFGCADCGMFGGWPYLAYQYLQRAGGMFSEADWPYIRNGVYPCMPEGYNKTACGNHDDLYCRKNSTKGQGPDGLCSASTGATARVTGWRALSRNETELAAQLVRYGPLSVLIEASGLQHYRSGVWKGGLFGCKPDPDAGILGLDHAVLLVGYGEERSILGMRTPYWKLKNSWGARWGESGYFRMERGTGMCGVNLAATTAEVAGDAAAGGRVELLV